MNVTAKLNQAELLMKRALLQGLVVFSAYLASGQGTVNFNNRNNPIVVTHVWFGCGEIRGNSTNDTPPGTTSYDGLVLVGTVGGLPAATTYASLLGAPGSNAPTSGMQAGALGTPFGGGTATTFRTGAAAGNIVGAIATFSNIPADAPVATFQMVVWDNSSGIYSTWALAQSAWNSGQIAAGFSDPFVVTNIGGFSNTPASLRGMTSFGFGVLECPPLFSLQPSNQAGVVGGLAMFAAQSRFSYTGKTNYQWYFNSSLLGGATNRILTLTNLQPENFGPYFVTVRYDTPPGATPRTSVVANLTFALSPSLKSMRSGPTSQLSFPTEVGPSYLVEFKTDLGDPIWIPLATNAGTGGVITVADSTTGVPSRFYRVRIL